MKKVTFMLLIRQFAERATREVKVDGVSMRVIDADAFLDAIASEHKRMLGGYGLGDHRLPPRS